jgi:HD-GYP domain-containing protein (c-di-GMP phosphodiesterase class II)
MISETTKTSSVTIDLTKQVMPPVEVFQLNDRRYILSVFERVNYISSTSTLEELPGKILDLLMEITGGDASLLCLLDSHTDELVFTSIKGTEAAKSLVGARINKGMGIIGEAVTKVVPIVEVDLKSNPRWLHALNPELSALWRSAITLPLTLPGKTIGVVQIFNFLRPELDLLTVLGNRLAVEFDRMSLVEKTDYKNRRFQSLLEIIGEISGTLDQSKLLKLVTQHTTRLLKTDRTSLFLLDSESNQVTQHVSYQNQGDEKTLPMQSIIGLLHKAGRDAKSSLLDVFQGRAQNARLHEGSGIITPKAVTMPLRSSSIQLGQQSGEKPRILGGLMVMHGQNDNFVDEDAQIIEIIANQTSSFLEVAQLYQDANELFIDVIKSMVTAIDAKDPYTQGHSIRVSELSVAIGEAMGLLEDEMHDLRIGSLLHDIGKIGIPDHILLKPGKLTEEEYRTIQSHPLIGSNIMGHVKLLKNSLPAIEQHHERLDGSGYPLGLKEHQMDLMGKIVGVADVYDAMTTDRPYRPAFSSQEVLTYLSAKTGAQFDAECVEALKTVIERDIGD